LQPKTERKIGCDAAIILANNKAQEFKVCCFEAKLPRLKTPKKSWDSKQQKTKLSHFSEQIKKQTHVSNKFAVWEIFYCEYDFKKQPSFMNDRKSSCIWHQDAYAKVQEKGDSNKWTNTDLQNLLTRVTYQTGIDDMVRDVCECKQGELNQKSSAPRGGVWKSFARKPLVSIASLYFSPQGAGNYTHTRLKEVIMSAFLMNMDSLEIKMFC
jgi:hypothetical protein